VKRCRFCRVRRLAVSPALRRQRSARSTRRRRAAAALKEAATTGRAGQGASRSQADHTSSSPTTTTHRSNRAIPICSPARTIARAPLAHQAMPPSRSVASSPPESDMPSSRRASLSEHSSSAADEVAAAQLPVSARTEDDVERDAHLENEKTRQEKDVIWVEWEENGERPPELAWQLRASSQTWLGRPGEPIQLLKSAEMVE
jgi:hypothetical protein